MPSMFTRRPAWPAVMAMTLSLVTLAGTAAQAAPLPPGSPAASAIRGHCGLHAAGRLHGPVPDRNDD
jgi:hypothetical protein